MYITFGSFKEVTISLVLMWLVAMAVINLNSRR
jgi:hypothetical protein